MPSHTAGGAIATARKSNGATVAAAEWRSNQIADAPAKQGAPVFKTNGDIDSTYITACGATQQAAALLGAVTNGANNHKVLGTRSDGSLVWTTKRDCTCPPPRPARGACTPSKPPSAPRSAADVQLGPESDVSSCEQAPRSAARGARSTARSKANAARKESTEKATAEAVAGAAATAKPSTEPAAADRFEALRSRVRAKITATGVGHTAPAGVANVEGEVAGTVTVER